MLKRIFKLTWLTVFVTSQALAARIQPLDHVVAIVNDQAVLVSDIDNMLNILVPITERADPKLPPINILRSQILKKIVDVLMQMQYAEKAGLTVDSATVTERVQAIADTQNMSLESFYQNLEEIGVSVENYREYLHNEILVARLQESYIARDVTISDAEIIGFLESPVGQDQSGVEYRLRHILLSLPNNSASAVSKLQADAKDVMLALKNNADFAKIAMEKSSSPNALKGGDLGWRSAGQLPTLFLNNVLAMQVGEVYGPIKTESGLHIIKLEEKRFDQERNIQQEYHIQQILVKTGTVRSSMQAQKILQELIAKLDKGADFAKLAKQYSDEKNTANKGGDLGWVTKEQVTPKFFAQLSQLKLNVISQPFETDEGWHIAVLLSQRSQINSTEAARNNAKNIIFRRKLQENIDVWIQRAREQTKVEIIDKNYAVS